MYMFVVFISCCLGFYVATRLWLYLFC